MRHEFLTALIDTGCAAAGRGWAPQFVLLRRAGSLAGAMALFAKNHSYGEYVFDWAWAEAHERHGIDYYPKLVCAVPFTPVRGPRLLASSDRARRRLVRAALELAKESSSLHVLFARDEDAAVLAERGGKPIASALFLRDERALYGRYWGALEHVPLLHFECCYYQAIEYAIARGLAVFEGGAQGEHKLFRGLMPVESLSAHWLAHPQFSRAVEKFLETEGAGVARYVNELCEHSPFKDG